MSNLLEKASILLTPTAYDDGKILSVKPEEVLGSELMPSIATIANLGGGSITQITENIYSSTSDGTSGSAVRPKFDFNTTAGKTYKLVITPIGTITGTINFDFYDGSTYLFQDYDFTTIKEITFTDNGTVFGAFNGQLAYSISNFKVSIKEEIDGDFDFTRNSSATRVNSQGLIEDVQTLSSNLVSNGDFSQEGSEEITNGDFSNGSTDWILTPSSGTAIVSDGKLNFTNSNSGGPQVSQAGRSYVIGKTYKITFTVTDYIQGNVRLSLGNNLTTSVSANGTFTQYITYASGLNRTYIYTANSTLSIDNVSVKEVGQDWTLGTGWSIGDDIANASGSANANISQNSFLTIGNKYKVTYTVLNASTGARVGLAPNGSTVQNIRTENGTYTEVYEAVNTSFYIRNLWNNNVGLSVSNISVVEITEDTNLPRINYEGFSYQDALGSELIVNGTFDSDTAWSKLNATISDGTGNLNGTGVTSLLYQNILTNGKTYKVTFTASDYNGLGVARVIDNSGSAIYTITSNGTFTFTFTHSNANGNFLFRATAGAMFSVDNVSVKEYLGQEPIPDSGCGSWLFEPQSTNLIPYSETLGNNTTTSGISFTYNNSISPDGTQNAALVSVTSGNDRLQPSFAAVNSLVAISIFLKHNGTDFTTQINTYNNGDGTLFGATANVTASNVTFTSYQGGFDSASFVDYGNGWFRVIVVCQSTTGTTLAQWRPTTVSGTLSYPCFGFQVEQQSYATSYIPTSGSTVTRLKDAAFGAGNSSLINSTEGVLYVEVAALAEQTLTRYITLSNGASSNRIIIYITDVGVIKFFVGVGGVTQAAKTVSGQTTTNFNKLAVSYKENDIKFYLNGVKVHTDTSASTFPANTLNVLNFAASNGTSSPFFGKTKCAAVFKEALTDAELTCLTTI